MSLEAVVVYAGHSIIDAEKFGSTYTQFPGGYPHRLIALDDTPAIVAHLPKAADYVYSNNAGWDNGTQQWAAN